MHQRGRRDERIGQAQAAAPEGTGSFGDTTVDDELLHAGEQPADGRFVGGVAGEQLGPGDHGVREATAPREAFCAFEVIDTDVGVDEQLSHGPTRHGWAR